MTDIHRRCDLQANVHILLSHSTPLFEKKGNARFPTLVTHGNNPFLFHRPSSRTAFPPDDSPTDAGEIELAEIFEQRLD